MTKLDLPQLGQKKDTVKKFQDVCVGLTILAVYAILWLLIGALGYRIYLLVF
jgi:hypothetical protein